MYVVGVVTIPEDPERGGGVTGVFWGCTGQRKWVRTVVSSRTATSTVSVPSWVHRTGLRPRRLVPEEVERVEIGS